MTLPQLEQTDEQRANAAEREALLKVHQAAASWFQDQLASAGGARIRRQIADRGITEETGRALGLGFAPRSRDSLKQALLGQGFSLALLLRAGLLVQREEGEVVDRFRNRLMIPICRDAGSVIAFGGRAVESDQQPKYLNSPETPIYTKSRTLYGLNLSKAAIRERGFAVLVEGYFDFAQVYQAGFQAVVASCGTALDAAASSTAEAVYRKVVLSFDPDAAGQGAAAKSCEMLVAEGFEVNVAMLPAGEDPDVFVRKHGQAGYAERLLQSRPYLEYLLDRVAASARPEHRRGPCPVPVGNVADRRADPGSDDAGPVCGPAGLQGQGHRRRGAGRNPEGGCSKTGHAATTGDSELRAGYQGRKGVDLVVGPRAATGSGGHRGLGTTGFGGSGGPVGAGSRAKTER